MKTLYFIIDMATIVSSIAAFFLACKLVLRTEKGLDKAMKLFLVVSMVLLVSALIQLNQYFGIISEGVSLIIFQVSRAIALFGFFLGLYEMLRVVNEASK